MSDVMVMVVLMGEGRLSKQCNKSVGLFFFFPRSRFVVVMRSSFSYYFFIASA